MAKTTQPETHKAQRQHRCSWCDEAISAGDTYTRYRWFNYGEAGTARMHPECHKAMLRAAKKESGWVEFMPGDFNRGCTCEKGENGCQCKQQKFGSPIRIEVNWCAWCGEYGNHNSGNCPQLNTQ